MIEINLLPLERRPVERTPMPRLITILVGVALVSAEVFFSLILFFYTIPLRTADLDAKKRILATKEETAKQADELEKSIAEVDERGKVVRGLYELRRTWTPIFDHLDEASILPDEVWLTNFEVTPPTDKPGVGKLIGYARGKTPTTTIGKFLAALQADEYFKEAFSKIDFRGVKEVALKSAAKQDKAGVKNLPAVASEFEVALEIKPPQVAAEKKSEKPARTKPAPKK